MVANAGAPFNITTGTDLNGDSIFNDRPAFSGGATGPTIVDTNFGSFNTSPAPGQATIPANFGSQSSAVYDEPALEQDHWHWPAAGILYIPTRSSRAKVGVAVVPAGVRAEGLVAAVREAWAARAGGGPMGGPERSNKRYSLTFSANARNVFNNVNPAPPIGNLSSGLFGQSTALAGGVFNTQSANRRVDLQVMFSF